MEGKKRISGLKLALKTSVVSGMTLISRILGLLRDIVFARYFGASLVMDAFLVANRIPNMLRRFFAEGAFSAGFVPVMARYREKSSNGWCGCSVSHSESPLSVATNRVATISNDSTSRRWDRRLSVRSSSLGLLGLGVGLLG